MIIGLVFTLFMVMGSCSPLGPLAAEAHDNHEQGLRQLRKITMKNPATEKRFHYTNKGLVLKSDDGRFSTTLGWRLQSRYSFGTRLDPILSSEFDGQERSSFEIRRARMKIGGHGYQPWIKYYFEVDWQSNRNVTDNGDIGGARLIDWRITLTPEPWLNVRIGQWKVDYNRERVDSSGNQTFAERSIVNRVFTLDRQIGAMVSGRLLAETPMDLHYYAGVFTGQGRGMTQNDDTNMMYLGRLQWNVLGAPLKWSQSDTMFHENPAAQIAMAGYTNTGQCTRWSANGCGTLSTNNSWGNAFTDSASATAGQYRTRGLLLETAAKYKGWAWQQEWHWKEVKDTGTNPHITALSGMYTNLSTFPSAWLPTAPTPLEIGFRYAYVDPNVGVANDTRREYTVAANWFFAGHRDKITVDLSRLTLDRADSDLEDFRFRVQWDVSF